MQYIGDNIRFLEESFQSLSEALQSHTSLLEAAKNNTLTPEAVAAAEQAVAAADTTFLFEEIPSAVKQSLEGVDRVTKIVRAMKEFSHPGAREKAPADLNRAIESTVTVTRNEWKYVAELKLELDPELPAVPCLIGEFNQCIVNLVVNASHAIGDVIKGKSGAKGTITICTRREGDFAEVRVTDTGTGIPKAARARIFEPFFTTKPLGQGTGQGLAIIYASIVRRHGGTVNFETELGKGTTFILRLPLVPGVSQPTTEAAQPA
jgi:signal transduction histidine kinase